MTQPDVYQNLQLLIAQRIGLRFDDTKRKELARHIDAAMKKFGIAEFGVYYAHLQVTAVDEDLWDDLVRRLTVGETYFFRDSAQCAALRNHILPALIQQHRAKQYPILRIWSAGCATGEEPYTLAMLLQELLPDFRDWTIMILATDINQDSLKAAERGIYRERAFRMETPDYIQRRYFRPAQQGYEILPEIRQMVSFAPLNLVSDDYPSFTNFTNALDLIICRNVTIYFHQETTRQIIKRFHGGLNEEGWLVVGHSEPMNSLYEGFEARNFVGAVVYQKAFPQTKEIVSASPPIIKPVAPIVRSTPQVQLAKPVEVQPSAQECYLEGKKQADQMCWSEALQWLTRALRQNPLLIAGHFTRGMILMNLNRNGEALEALRRCLYIDRSFVMAHYTIGLLHQRMGHFKDAERAWATVVDYLTHLDPNEVLPHGDGITAHYLLSVMNSTETSGR